MLSSFNFEKLNALLRDFHTLTGMRITIFDEELHELTSCPQEMAGVCRYIRDNPEAEKACRDCDRRACMKASALRRPYVYRCHAGLTEAVAPVFMGNLPVAYLMFGHLLSDETSEAAQKNVLENCAKYDLDPEHLKDLLALLPLTDEGTVLAASRILMAVTSWLCIDQMISLKKQELPVRIDDYLETHLQEPLDAGRLCEVFQIGKTALYKISREYYGEGIAEHIRRMRIERARKLLAENADLSIHEISEQCGFTDYNYFMTVFRKYSGTSPARYRRETGKNRSSAALPLPESPWKAH
ncbi:MAG: PocR ligand-binding domain-containing protein [Lachnospiraceae bacterium]|nr:PocR ligand-binding domain-containing protein [Lachnospiraceae bacterium]